MELSPSDSARRAAVAVALAAAVAAVAACSLSGCGPVRGSRAPGGAGGPFLEAFAPEGLGRWTVTSGRWERRAGLGWTDSGVFRAVTRRDDFKDFELSVAVRLEKLSSSAATPPVDWDGVHVFLRYESQYRLYAATLMRRDGKICVKKKVPGGPSNGGTYYNLTGEVPYPPPAPGQWRSYRIVVDDTPEGAVSIKVYSGADLLLDALDDGRRGGPPIAGPGKVGLRGDNAEFSVRELAVAPR